MAFLLNTEIEMSDDIGNKPVETAGRASNGRFTSGNPGRPRGARNKHSLTSYRALAEMSSTALVQLINNVMAGDQRAIEYILDRILPQGRLIELDPTVEGVSEALNAAEVSTKEARDLATVLEKMKRVAEMDALQERIAALEASLQETGK